MFGRVTITLRIDPHSSYTFNAVFQHKKHSLHVEYNNKLEMWANAQCDGHPAKHGALCSTPQSLADAYY